MSKGRNRVTIVDIANRAGVSFKTVSRVLNANSNVSAELRQRVERVMRELDYRPNLAARSLRGNRAFAIGLLIGPLGLDQDGTGGSQNSAPPTFFMSLQAGAIMACRSAGYQLTIESVDLRSKRLASELAQQFRNLRVDGVLLCPPLVDMTLVTETLTELGTPFVQILPGRPSANSPSLFIDDRGAAEAMTRRLIQAGHRRIGFISGPPAHVAASKRQAGFLKAMAAHESCEPQVLDGNFTFDSGMRAGLDLLTAPSRPSAIFAANDDMAAGVLAAAMRLGLKVPDDLSVAGFDDSLVATLVWPPLTTVRQPIVKMAQVAVEHLVRAAGEEESMEPAVIEMPYEIVERQSARLGKASAGTNRDRFRGP